jgi:membrane-associated phospholipid phosphatase
MENKLKKIVLGLFLLCGIAVVTWASFSLDAPVRAAVIGIEGSNWDHSFQKTIVGSVSRYGDWPELMALGAVGFLIAKKRRNLKWQRLFLIAMVASTLAGTMVNTLRLTTGRTRPRVSPAMEQAWYGPYHEGKWTVGHAEYNSFPSGHTATAMAFAAIIFLGSPFWGIVALFLAALVASSRVLLGAHHPSDLIAATLLSFALAWWLWKYRDHVLWNQLFKLH